MKYCFLFFLLLITAEVAAQESDDFDRNEIKINPINLLFNPPWISVAYERLLNDESSIGSNILFITDDGESVFGATPYYRLFFGKNKPAAGFFVEGAGLFLTGSGSDSAIFGVSLAIGVKVLTKRNVVLDIFGGLGRWSENNFITGSAYGRFGVNIGKRF